MGLDFSLEYKCDNNKISVFETNITHNLAQMADKAGIYYALWRPEEKNYKIANDIIKILEKGIKRLKTRQKYFEKFNALNGWGTYKHFVPFVQEVLDACYKYPSAKIIVSK